MERGTVGIAGLGLIGASIGQGLMSGFASKVIGYDPSSTSLAYADGCADIVTSNLSKLSECELIVVAAPPLAVPDLLSELAQVANPECTFTDVTSVKRMVVESLPYSIISRFVPGHPMAGHESTGSKYARSDLFHGAKWILCPDKRINDDSFELVLGMVRHLRALPVLLSAEEHDAHVAVLSHMPHVFAALLLLQADDGLSRPDIAGGSWADLTRVGGANPELWADILLSNKEAMLESLNQSGSLLDQFKIALEKGDRKNLVHLFEQARLSKHK